MRGKYERGGRGPRVALGTEPRRRRVEDAGASTTANSHNINARVMICTGALTSEDVQEWRLDAAGVVQVLGDCGGLVGLSWVGC